MTSISPRAGVFSNDYDVDAGDVFTLTRFDAVSALGATVSISPEGALLYNPLNAASLQALRPGQSLQDTFTYTITDTYRRDGHGNRDRHGSRPGRRAGGGR